MFIKAIRSSFRFLVTVSARHAKDPDQRTQVLILNALAVLGKE